MARCRTRVAPYEGEKSAVRVISGDWVELFSFGEAQCDDSERWTGNVERTIEQVSGEVLLIGLGLGVTLDMLFKKPWVTSVTVLEINPEIIERVGQHFPNIRMVQGDQWQWEPDRRFDWVVYMAGDETKPHLLKQRFAPFAARHTFYGRGEI